MIYCPSHIAVDNDSNLLSCWWTWENIEMYAIQSQVTHKLIIW